MYQNLKTISLSALFAVVFFTFGAGGAVAQGDNNAGDKKSQQSNGPASGQQGGGQSGQVPTLESVLGELRARRSPVLARLKQREAEFQQKLAEAREELSQAQARIEDIEGTIAVLENSFDSNKEKLERLTKLLTYKLAELDQLFGVFQQKAGDLRAIFLGSPTSHRYPERGEWLIAFAKRMKDASEVSSAEDIKRLWHILQRGIVASSNIVKFDAPVVGEDGKIDKRTLVRLGNFHAITADPTPAYVLWQANGQQFAELSGKPADRYLDWIGEYLAADQGVHLLGLDPAGGGLLTRLARKPTLSQRIDQGGLVGYVIVVLGVIALILSVYKLAEIFVIGARVRAQRQDRDKPGRSNALGRLLQVYEANRGVDNETLALRLDETVVKERGRVNRFLVFLSIIAAVAPLLGLLGTVVGMINTFQAITLYGTGNPQTMAGGISQALITTVLGLSVAVPTVLLHALAKSRARAVEDILQQECAALTGDQLQARGQAESGWQGGGASPSPATT